MFALSNRDYPRFVAINFRKSCNSLCYFLDVVCAKFVLRCKSSCFLKNIGINIKEKCDLWSGLLLLPFGSNGQWLFLLTDSFVPHHTTSVHQCLLKRQFSSQPKLSSNTWKCVCENIRPWQLIKQKRITAPEFFNHQIKKSNLYYTRFIPFWVSRVSGAHLRGFAPGPILQGCSGGELLATCRRFDLLGIWTPHLPHQRQTSYHLCHLSCIKTIRTFSNPKLYSTILTTNPQLSYLLFIQIVDRSRRLMYSLN